MKKAFRNIVFLSISTVALTSCDWLFPQPKITQIVIEDFHNAYALGDNFIMNQELSILAKWNDGRTTVLDPYKSSYTMTIDGASHSVNDGFTKTGTYKVAVKKGTITSNTIDIHVQEERVYATSFDLVGDATFKALQPVQLAVNVTPSNFTQRVEFTLSNNDVLDVKRTKTGLELYGEFVGECDITVSIRDSETTYLSKTHHVTVLSPVEKTVISQTYHDYMAHSHYPLNSCPVEGTPKLLVIPVWFSDSDNYISTSKKASVRSDIQKAYFGTSSETGWESVSTFYNKESSGELTLQGTVADWYAPGNSSAYYAYNTSTTVSLVKQAVSSYFHDHPTDARTNYDYDGDGYLDGVMLIYAAPDYRTAGDASRSNLWAYCYWCQTEAPSTALPSPNVFFWASYDFLYGSNTASERTGYSYAGGDTSHCNIDTHTFIHEMGHVLGVEDYYDYSNQCSPAAGFSMQDYNVGGHDPYSVMAFGWADPYIPTESVTLRIGEFQKTHELILLTPNFNSYNSPFDEYLLLELYSPTGLNKFDCDNSYEGYYPMGPSQVGIRLWHVDARLTQLKSPMPSTPKFYTSALNNDMTHAMSNTYYTAQMEREGRTSPLGQAYCDYNILQLIRNDEDVTYKPKTALRAEDLFYEGDIFNMTKYDGQFKKNAALNSGKKLGWKFSIDKITSISGVSYATVTLTKL